MRPARAVVTMGGRKGPPHCRGCGRELPKTMPRVQGPGGAWLCPDCAYRVDHPNAPRVSKPRKPSKPQAEELPLYGGDPA